MPVTYSGKATVSLLEPWSKLVTRGLYRMRKDPYKRATATATRLCTRSFDHGSLGLTESSKVLLRSPRNMAFALDLQASYALVCQAVVWGCDTVCDHLIDGMCIKHARPGPKAYAFVGCTLGFGLQSYTKL